MAIDEQITALEAEIRKTPYNKATSHHIGKLKAKLAALREEKIKRAAKSGGGGPSYAVKKSGHASVALVGFPSVGKSTLLNKLTNAQSEVAAYEFTTLTCIPGMMTYRGAEIQVLDLPGLIRGAAGGKGRGREVIAVVRSSDLVLLIADALNPEQALVIVDELYDAGIRLNTRPPDVKIYQGRVRGGIEVAATTKLTHLSTDLVHEMVKEFGFMNADVVVRQDVTADELIDVLAGNRAYMRAVVALNKVDTQDPGFVKEAIRMYEGSGYPVVPIAATREVGLDRLREVVYENLHFMNIFMKPQGKEADMVEPLVCLAGSTIGTVCDMLHRDMRRKFRYAIVSGPSAKFPNQIVGLEHVLQDKDVLTLVTRRS
ncbi:MAG: OBG GTPase family GTP-binding protein [Methanobacteriota archaeon]